MNKGSYTVEAALIIGTVIFSIVALIYMAFFMYNKAILQGMADKIASDTANSISHEIDIKTGEIAIHKINNRFLYWRFTDNHSSKISETAAHWSDFSKRLFSTSNEKLNISYENKYINRYILVKLQSNYEIPFNNVIQMLTGGRPIIIKVESRAAINEPSELVRNVNLLYQSAYELEALQEPMNKYHDAIQGIKDKLMEKGEEE